MKIEKKGKSLQVDFEGLFDKETENELEHLLVKELHGVEKLSFDLKGIGDISSIGLRFFSYAQKIMNEQGIMYMENAEYWVESQCRMHDIVCAKRKE